MDLFLPTSGDRPFYGAIMAMVERRDGPALLRDDDDDDDDDDEYRTIGLCSVLDIKETTHPN